MLLNNFFQGCIGWSGKVVVVALQYGPSEVLLFYSLCLIGIIDILFVHGFVFYSSLFFFSLRYHYFIVFFVFSNWLFGNSVG